MTNSARYVEQRLTGVAQDDWVDVLDVDLRDADKWTLLVKCTTANPLDYSLILRVTYDGEDVEVSSGTLTYGDEVYWNSNDTWARAILKVKNNVAGRTAGYIIEFAKILL